MIRLGFEIICAGCQDTLFLPVSGNPLHYGKQLSEGINKAGWIDYVGHYVCTQCPHDPSQYSFYDLWLFENGLIRE